MIRFNLRNKIPLLPKISGYWLFAFMLWPFGALISALRDFRQPYAKTIFWLFCIYFGFTFITSENLTNGSDSARYSANLKSMHKQPVSFNTLFTSFYNKEDGNVDIYQPLVTWVVSVFTDNTHYLFLLFAMVFGFFYTQNLWIFYTKIHTNIELVLFLFMMSLALVLPIWNINGVRMWTAAHIFIYGCLKYFIYNDKNGLIWSACSILVHFSFLFPVSLLFIYIFIPQNISIFFIFFVASSFLKEIDMPFLKNALSNLPGVFQHRVEIYARDPAGAQSFNDIAPHLSWHVTLAFSIMHWLVYGWVAVVFWVRRYWEKQSPTISKLFAFALYFGGWAQIASLVPSGGRFITIADFLFVGIFILIIIHRSLRIKLRVIKAITIPFIAFSVVFGIRTGFDYAGIMLVFGNPLFAIFFSDRIPLIDFVKQIF